MFRLANPVRSHAWGSRLQIPRLLGIAPEEHPMAELWLGAHPGDPSTLDDGTTLREAIAGDPVTLLGRWVHEHLGPTLPFLMKVLAVAEPLSLQVHPSRVDAEAGFAREQAAGIPLDDPRRCYVDASHKPELIYALTRFEGMAGFRDPLKTAEILRVLELDWLDRVADELVSGPPEPALRTVIERWLRQATGVAERTAELRTACERASRERRRIDPRPRPGRRERSDVSRECLRVYEQIVRLADRYPADPSVWVALLLNHVVLAPGEALFVDAGMIHSYTFGLGVEVMASSDNVLRAGLTPKHTDLREFLAITDFTPTAARLAPPILDWDGGVEFHPPAEFALHIAEAPTSALPASGPRVLLVLDGRVEISTRTESESLQTGQAVFLSDRDGPAKLIGSGRVAVCSVPGS